MVIAALVAGPAAADSYYYGVACDEFTASNDHLWDALNDLPEWSSYSAATVEGDETWASGTHVVLHDEAWGDHLISGIESFAGYVGEDDLFIFHYMAHTTRVDDPNSDDGTEDRPEINDPHPNIYRPGGDPDVAYDGEPYNGDEASGLVGYQTATDDLIAAAFAAVPESATVMTIFDTCYAAGLVGGSNDMNDSQPADSHGLYVAMAVPEQGAAVGTTGPSPDKVFLLTRSLAATAQGSKTADEWFQDALDYGATHTHYMLYYGGWKDYYYWPEDNYALPGTKTDDHWDWQEDYLQLRPGSWSSMDVEHDVPVFTPEPGTIALFGLGLLGLGAKLRRRKES